MLPLIDWHPHAPLQRLHLDWLHQAGVEVAVLRLDLIDPLISGNKWFKLTEHLCAAHQAGADGLISLGGAHSNHLHALAAAGKRFGFATVGLLRGHPQQTPTTLDLERYGMQLHWLGFAGYRARHEPGFWQPWQARYPNLHQVPEGGGGLTGALGCKPLVNQVREQLATVGWDGYDGWWLAGGTGTTLAGLMLGEAGRRRVYGALAVPEDHGVAPQVEAILQAGGLLARNVELIDASRGGFARVDDALLGFMRASEAASGLPLEPLYTAKALMALEQAVKEGVIARGMRLVFVHTGGLQGRRGFA
ncbi:1-aminocyclopropane-1-carboxylate deaminase/D-cysteine desulfhydrase [Pseudomonas fragi]|uniref:1-aminocyclopropane-1-carboxylate deaminase/D-cysteine desulfhydrase n=1 Tax=Pseudomonas fragi TaxID=296 RepID=UPI002D766073|nr:pyridoxal-phosphate dependent enzyme [Pseudomonas fragi]WRT58972.1 pyridoxal-phosphate dependent enzyme [Pseudomonas fragi]